MERQEQQTKQIQEPTASEDQTQATTAEADHEEPVTPTPLQRFRALLDSAQRGQSPVASRRELGRDKSKSLFVLVGASVALLLLFFGLFSSPKNRGPLPGETARGGPSLGRKVATGQEQNDPAKTVTPLLSADVNRGDVGSGSQVTAEDVGGTSPRYNGTRKLPGGNAAALEKPSRGQSTRFRRICPQGRGFLRSRSCAGSRDSQSTCTALRRVRFRPEEALDCVCARCTERDTGSSKSSQ